MDGWLVPGENFKITSSGVLTHDALRYVTLRLYVISSTWGGQLRRGVCLGAAEGRGNNSCWESREGHEMIAGFRSRWCSWKETGIL